MDIDEKVASDPHLTPAADAPVLQVPVALDVPKVLDEELSEKTAEPAAIPRSPENDSKVHSDAPQRSDVKPKSKLLSRGTVFMKKHFHLSLACAISLAAGWGLGALRGGSNEPIVDDTSASLVVPEKTYLASISRRNEPIKPLVPFEGLDPQVVELGRRLFHESALSGNGRISCATCHLVGKLDATETLSKLGVSGEATQYDAPTLLNAGYNLAQFWDGRATSLEEQVEHPLTDSNMLGSSWERVIKYLSKEPSYARAFKVCFRGVPTPERVQSALATYERSLVTPNSKLDQWLAGNEKSLSADEFGGYFLFKKYDCISCHQGAAVGGSMFQRLGVAKPYYTNTLAKADLGRFNVTERERDRAVFRVPALRNVELTAPYFHDGSVATLESAVEKMIEYQCGEQVNQENVRRIVAFLKTLTGELPNP